MIIDITKTIELLGGILGFGRDGGYLGVYATLGDLTTAHPTANEGSTATVLAPDGNLFWYNGAAWVDTGTGFLGDMLKAVYDPGGVNANAFSMGNMSETAAAKILTATERNEIAANTLKVSNVTTNLAVIDRTATALTVASSDGTDAIIPLATTLLAGLLSAAKLVEINANTAARHAAVTLNPDAKTQAALVLAGQEIQIKADVYNKANETGVDQINGAILTPPAVTVDQADYNPAGFATANMIRIDVSPNDVEFSGFQAPAVGVNRIIRVLNIGTKKLKLRNNDAASLAANRVLTAGGVNIDVRTNGSFQLWYDHASLRWRTLSARTG